MKPSLKIDDGLMYKLKLQSITLSVATQPLVKSHQCKLNPKNHLIL